MKPNQIYPTAPACYAALYPTLARVAKHHGYALAIHGSMIRDFDLIAVPWQAECAPPLELVHAIKAACAGVFHTQADDELLGAGGNMTPREHGRLAWSIHLTDAGADGPYIDLSVMPTVQELQTVQTPLEKCLGMLEWTEQHLDFRLAKQVRELRERLSGAEPSAEVRSCSPDTERLDYLERSLLTLSHARATSSVTMDNKRASGQFVSTVGPRMAIRGSSLRAVIDEAVERDRIAEEKLLEKPQ